MEHLNVDGRRIEYRWAGPGPESAPTLVFLHQGLGCAAMWRDFPDRLAAATGWGALVYSRAGYGGSDPVALPRPLDYLETEGLEILPRVLDAAGVRRAALVGHSDGASIALVHAGGVRDPRVTGAVIMAPHVFTDQFLRDGIRETRAAYEDGPLRDGLAPYHDHVDVAFWGWCDAWLHPEFRRWNIEHFLPAIDIPLLLIQGKDDEYGTPAQVEAIERQVAGPSEILWLPDCTHSLYRDRPEAVLRAIRSFVPALAGSDPI